MKKLWILIYSVLFIFASPAYAHGGVAFTVGVILIWGVLPLFIISLVVLPLCLLFGKLFHLKKKLVVAIGVVVTILIYLLSLPNLQSIINWLVDLQYYFD